MSADEQKTTQTKTTKATRPKAKAKAAPKKTKAKKPDKNLEKIATLESELKATEEKYIRVRAEFDNYRRRKDREFLRLLEYEGEAIIKAVLPVIDDLERMENAMANDTKAASPATVDGIRMITRRFEKILSERGVEAYQAVGEQLDSELHDAMMVMQDENKSDGEILQEHEKGYKYKDKVLRHAKVVVNKI